MQRQFAYRIANWAGLFTNSFFLFFRAGVFEACYRSAESESGVAHDIDGLDAAGALSYAVLSQSLIMVAPFWGRVGLSEDVRNLFRSLPWRGIRTTKA